ncbi:MAG: response regulator [Candidatus Omnitrophota bacterium]
MAKILIIEDGIDTAKVLEKRMRDLGHDVIVVYDACFGTQQVHKGNPDLIILDLMLPAGGGISILENMKMYAPAKQVPVVVLTAMRDEERKKRVLELGVAAYIEKPYDPEYLENTIKTVLAERGK